VGAASKNKKSKRRDKESTLEKKKGQIEQESQIWTQGVGQVGRRKGGGKKEQHGFVTPCFEGKKREKAQKREN